MGGDPSGRRSRGHTQVKDEAWPPAAHTSVPVSAEQGPLDEVSVKEPSAASVSV